MTKIIPKENFVFALEAIQQQLANDKKSSELMAEAFGTDEFVLYDNSLLIKQIISLLTLWFDREELEHYIFDLNFGRIGEEVETIEEFYHRLKKSDKNGN